MENDAMKKHTSPFIVIAVVILAVGLAFFAFQLLFIQPDSKKVACSELPSAEQVQNILTEHTDIIQELGRLGPENTIRFDADATRCPGKADIFIIYGTEKQRHQIKDRIGDNFFGIPYRMANM